MTDPARAKHLPLLEDAPRAIAEAVIRDPFDPGVTREVLTRDQRRSRRKHPVRASTISVRRLGKGELAIGRALFPELPSDEELPGMRAECERGDNAERPCPFVSCKHHLYLDVSPRTGSIKLNFPDLEVDELAESCALDLAARGGMRLEAVGEAMNLTRERVRQIEVKALGKLAKNARAARVLRELAGDGQRTPVRPVDAEREEGEDFDVEGFVGADEEEGGEAA